MKHVIRNVEALWPKLNTTYHFVPDVNHPNGKGQDQPCDALDTDAKYSLSFKMSKEEARNLYAVMLKEYKAQKNNTWPEKPINPFTQDKENPDLMIGKTVLKGAYHGKPTNKPAQYDAKGDKLPDDFLLTTGSKVNISVTIKPYYMRDAGVSLRIRAVQVLDLAEYVPPQTDASAFGFDKEDGYDLKEDQSKNSSSGAQEYKTPTQDPFGREFGTNISVDDIPPLDGDDEIPF